MGLFDFFKKKSTPAPVPQVSPTPVSKPKVSVPVEEKKYYQPDSYYTDVTHPGTPFEQRVVTFEERKKTAIPSAGGLYPAEILLLEYCSKGTYPAPKTGYPGFWWFAYGIRDVGAALETLEERGFISFAPANESVKGFTVQQLKELLAEKGLPATGKKADLVVRVAEAFSEEELLAKGIQRKYALTDKGQYELAENAYVPYMHSVPNKTTEDDRFGITFNVWSINKLLGTGDKSNWKAVVDAQLQQMNSETTAKNDALMSEIKKYDPAGYRELKTQDQQIAAVQAAQEKYSRDNDLDAYIAFWEHLWSHGGLKFEGAGWHFKLPDLYIKAKRYDEALEFVTKLKKSKPGYAYKSDAYITKITDLKAKQRK